MSKVTTKLQVTVPKQIADRYGIKPGDEITWLATGDSIRVVPGRQRTAKKALGSRLHLFDAATERQQARNGAVAERSSTGKRRGWTREDLYERGGPR